MPAAIAVAAVISCEPGSPMNDQLAIMPVVGVAHDPGGASCVVSPSRPLGGPSPVGCGPSPGDWPAVAHPARTTASHRRDITLTLHQTAGGIVPPSGQPDRKSTRLNSSHVEISYAVFCLKKKKNHN